ncbi:hydrolase, partial [Leclercia adecarboxylata]|nr:hydrolase [Leclercia adecarboxylata]
ARELNDRAYALDHFQTKLLRLPETMQTDAGRQLARQSADVLIQFMARLSAELRGDYDGIDTAVLQRFRDSL